MADILVVDDDDNMRSLIKTVLERRGHRTTEARDGMEGLARFEEKQPELVITDMVMPGVGGQALFNELQRAPLPPKILVVSGKGNPPDGDWAMLTAQGMAAFLPKPFTPAELAAAVQGLLRAEQSAKAG